ncbi:MAG: bacterial Ig-like domain-containing protein [Bacteroidaceae bacterium]|nr:bacterial Ig-like domain-containing protein [Bacteroidaceae bacterium]
MKQKLLNKLWLRVWMLVAIMTTALAGTASAETKTFDFKFETIGTTGWGNSYAAHSYAYDEGTVKFTAASKQTGTITVMPVSKGQPVEFIMEDGYTISAAEFVCQQWGSKAQTITLHYSTDGGSTYTSTDITSSNFTISSDALPSGTNAVKITFSSQSNQVGIKNLTLTYATSGGTVDPSVATSVTIDDSGITNTDVYAGTEAGSLAATVVDEDNNAVSGATVTWSGNNDAVATIDASTGAVTLVAAGKVKFTASYAGVENEYKASSATYEMTVTDTTPFTGGDVVFESSVLSSDTETSLTKSVVTISGSKLGSSYYQAYKGADFTISTTFGNITQIVFECTSSNPASGFDDAEGFVLDGDNGVWTGEAKEVTLTASNKQVRMTKITVTVEAETPKVLSSIALSGNYPTTFHVGDAFSSEGIVVTATYESGKTADVTASAEFTGYDMATAGAQTVTVSYSEGEVTATATYTITVNAPATLTGITLSGTYPTEFEQGDAFSSEGIVVTANYDDNTTADVTAEATFSGYDMATIGEQTVTVTYGGQTASYSITVVEKSGTLTKPYTVAEAIAATPTSGTSANVYIHGYVSAFYSSTITGDETYHRYYISDDGTTSNQLMVFNGKKRSDTAFSADDDIRVGDVVTIYGGLTTYNSTKEVAKDNYIVSHKLVAPTFSPSAGAVASGTTVEISDLHTDATIYYTTDGTEPTESSTEYTGAITITAEQTIKAIAVKSGYTTSDVAEAAYTINLTPEITVTAANPVNVIADGGSGELTLTYTNFTVDDEGDFAVQFYDENDDEISDPNWIGVAVEDADPSGYKVSYVVLANNGDARTAYFKVWALVGSTPIYSNKVTVTQAAPVEYVALVAQYDGKFYAVDGSTFSSGTYGAAEVDAVNGKVITNATDDITFELTTSGETQTIQNMGTSKYIGYGTSGTDLKQQDDAYYWTIDATNASWNNGASTLRSIVYRDGYGFKAYATSNIGGSGYASSYTSAYTFADGYTRDVTAGSYGTICLPYNVEAEDFSGVKFYSISGKKMDGTTLEYVTLQEETSLVGGAAYIFKANEEATKLVAAYSGTEETVPFDASLSGTGLTGTYSKQYIPVGKYVLKGGTIYYVDQADYVYSGANKAYIDLKDVPEVGASAVKGICLFGEDFDIETGIKSVDGSQEFNETYNLSGQRIQKAQRGVNIVNGKKVLY